MIQSRAKEYLRRAGVGPLVRPTRTQAEVALLPPYGDPEVSLLGEFGTYVVVGAAAIAIADRLAD